MYFYSYFAGWCNGSTSRSEREAAGSNPDPATKTESTSGFVVVKGGGEVKKKLRCFYKRFAALVAALSLCASLCVPCLAANNAQWRKWVVTGEREMTNENGTMSRYLHLTPFQDGKIYAANILSHISAVSLNYEQNSSNLAAGPASYFISALNYPDWWRSAIPLGAMSYVQVDVKKITADSTPFPSTPTAVSSCLLYFFDSANSVNLSVDMSSYVGNSVNGYGGSLSQSSGSPLFISEGYTVSNSRYSASFVTVQPGSSSIIGISNFNNVRFGWPINHFGGGISFDTVPLVNLSSERLVIAAVSSNSKYCSVNAEISFWVDANKLPAGLKVGDEFPSDSDAFDNLRDELIKQFPEASENIQNGKDTMHGWNDTETVDTDVASTSISVLNALFQNLGGFLFVISLMVFGAVVLRMLIRKAVDG